MPQLELITEEDRHFVKFFLLDGKANLNDWGVTEQALKNNIASFIDKPFILRADFGHPDAFTGDHLLMVQEHDRVGNIFSVGIEEDTGKAWGMAEITSKWAQDILKRGEVTFVSPSIVFSEFDLEFENGIERATKFEGAHVAAVKEPAYGMQKAQIKGQCSGSPETCTSQLLKVQANVGPKFSRSKCGKTLKIVTGSKVYVLKATKCMEDCLSKKKDSGKEIDDQAIAICLKECGESKDANIDPTSLKNITKVDLLHKKKKKDGECVVDQLGNCVKHTTHKAKKGLKKARMAEDDKDKENANEEELKKRREEESEEDEDKKESKKGQEDEDKKDAQEDEDKKMDAEDEDKEDAEDDEEKKESKKAIRDFRKELKALREEISKTQKEPLVSSILAAKINARHITEAEKSAESRKLYSMSNKLLARIASDYEKVGSEKRPYSVLEYKSASIDKSDGDSFLMELGCGGN